MNRRHFLKNTTASAVALSASALIPYHSNAEESNNISIDTEKNGFQLYESTIDDLQTKQKTGEYTSRTITEMYLKRIQDLDKNGPEINAIIELNPDALVIADQMDAERKAGKITGLLHGIPVLIKDNIDTGDKMMTTAGSLAMIGNIAGKDAFIIKQLRAAGAVLLGKTNLSEWANFRSTRASSGWSSRGGQTKNPCVLDRNPCGSSSGSGAAVAANFCAVAIGTETDGSVIAPASMCGIVGIKPTVGLLSRAGIIPISKTQDTAGPMARTVRDAVILLGALSGIDPEDSATTESKSRGYKDYVQFLDSNGMKGKRIGVEKMFFEGHPDVVELYKNAIELMKKQGAVIVEIELMKAISILGEAEFTVFKYEFKEGLNRYLLNANAKVKSLGDVIAFNKANEKNAMPWFKQEILISCQEKQDLNTAEYKESLEKSLHSRQLINDLMNENQLDALCGTSIGFANCIDLVNGDYETGFYFCPPAAMAGYPHITVPMGKVHELPVGLSFVSGAWKEPDIIKIAYAYEQASKKRVAPEFIRTIASK